MMIVSPGSPLEQIIDEARRFARSDATVLVTGETGTGKEVFARLIHDASPRQSHAFVAVNCGAIPESLIEAELFGHVKGAFTGAHAARKGRVAMAQGGTLFLDELGELSLPMQVKLLRLLQQRTYEPVGSSETLKADFRLVAATNRDLSDEVAAGRFRSDLYYRIYVCPLHLPPLRDRGVDDLKALFFSFWKKLGDARSVDDSVFEALRHYPWPGNVRELENFVERLSVCARGDVIVASDVPDSYRHTLPPRSKSTTTGTTATTATTGTASIDAGAHAAAAASVDDSASAVLDENNWLDALPGAVEDEEPAAMSAMSALFAPPAPQVPAAPIAAPVVVEARAPVVVEAPAPAVVDAPAAPVAPAATTARAENSDGVRLPIDLAAHLDAIERAHIEAALRATSGNKQASADLLGLQRTTLVAKCKKHGLEEAGKNADDGGSAAGLRVELAEEQRPVLLLRGASFKVCVIREDTIELVPLDDAASSLTDVSPVAGSCVVDTETLRLFGALRGRDGGVHLELAIPLERSQLVSLQRSLVRRRPRGSTKAAAAPN